MKEPRENELDIREPNQTVVRVGTQELIKAGVSENTYKVYRRVLKDMDAWMTEGDNAFRLDGNGSSDQIENDQTTEHGAR